MRVTNCRNIVAIALLVGIFTFSCACSQSNINTSQNNLPIPTENNNTTQGSNNSVWPNKFQVLFSENQDQAQKYLFALGMQKSDVQSILKERNIKITLDESHGSDSSSLWGENIQLLFDKDEKLKEVFIRNKAESLKGLRIGDNIEHVYELYGKEQQSYDEKDSTILQYIYTSNFFNICINKDKIVTGMGIYVLDPQKSNTQSADIKNAGTSSTLSGAGSAIPKEGMKNLESIKGSYFKAKEGKQGKLEILNASPMEIKFEIQTEDNVMLQGNAQFVEGTDQKNAKDYFKKAIYENGKIIFEKLDNGNINISYLDKPDYSGEWFKN